MKEPIWSRRALTWRIVCFSYSSLFFPPPLKATILFWAWEFSLFKDKTSIYFTESQKDLVLKGSLKFMYSDPQLKA